MVRRSSATDERTATLYGMPHSHPVVAARLMLERSGVEHEVRNILPGLHAPVVRALGFPRWTVPALRIDGKRIQGTLAISRLLDRLAPDAGLFPRDPDERRAVEEAERWGHDRLQPVARRVFRWAGAHSNAVRSVDGPRGGRLPAPAAFGLAFTPVMLFFAATRLGRERRHRPRRPPPPAAASRRGGRAARGGGARRGVPERGRLPDLQLTAAAARTRGSPTTDRAVEIAPGRRSGCSPTFPAPGPRRSPRFPRRCRTNGSPSVSPGRGRARRARGAGAARKDLP